MESPIARARGLAAWLALAAALAAGCDTAPFVDPTGKNCSPPADPCPAPWSCVAGTCQKTSGSSSTSKARSSSSEQGSASSSSGQTSQTGTSSGATASSGGSTSGGTSITASGTSSSESTSSGTSGASSATSTAASNSSSTSSGGNSSSGGSTSSGSGSGSSGGSGACPIDADSYNTTFNGLVDSLWPACGLNPTTLPGSTLVGQATSFNTNDPNYTCAQSGVTFDVYSASSPRFVDFATEPGFSGCAAATWSFPVPCTTNGCTATAADGGTCITNTDNFDAGLSGWSYTGDAGYALSVQSGAATISGQNPPLVQGIAGGMKKAFSIDPGSFWLAFDWSAQSTGALSTTTNAQVQLWDDSGNVLVNVNLIEGGTTASGWQHSAYDLSYYVQGLSSVTVVFYLHDYWSTDWHEVDSFNDIQISSCPGGD